MIKAIRTKASVILATTVLSAAISHPASALQPFVIRDIRINGLHRIQEGTVLNYLPVRVGDTVDGVRSTKILRALYATGFFNDVSLSRRGSTLVIYVDERFTIGRVSVDGNELIKADKINEVLKQVGLTSGQVFDQSVLDHVRSELKSVYNSNGKYNARIDVQVTKLSRNRVGIHIKISEGKVAKIKEIKIIGNEVYSTSELLKDFYISSGGLTTFFTQKDQYSAEKLTASLEIMKSFYMDHGYIKMTVDSVQVSLTPDRKHVYVTITITEGPRYRFAGYDLNGNFILPEDKVRSLITIKQGEVFSRKVMNDSITAIGNAIGDFGYGFPEINAEPQFDEENKTVFMHINAQPGKRVYVRRVGFTGNTRTADYVLRHAMRQYEGALLQVSKVRESERQLRMLGFLKNITVKTEPVPGTNDQVDLIFGIEEMPSTQISASVGYGTTGLEFNAGLNEPNFLGTGKNVSFNFLTRSIETSYSFSFYDPYYSDIGIGRGFSAYYTKWKPGNRTVISSYTMDRVGGLVSYNFDVNDNNSLQLSAGLEHMRLTTNPFVSQYAAFSNQFGDVFDEVRLGATWEYNSYDQALFPTSGFHHSFNSLVALPLRRKDLYYYKLSYDGHVFEPLFAGFIFTGHGVVGYGNGFGRTNTLPYFENSFAGGVQANAIVRGFDDYSLGPQDSAGNALGGNLYVGASVGLILPHPLSTETVRTSVFFDAGNVYSRNIPAQFRGTSAGRIRYSAGVGVEWHSPFGPFQVSLAKPLNLQPQDRASYFQFTMATNG